MKDIFATHMTNLNDVLEVRPLDGDTSNTQKDNLTPLTLGWLCRFVLGSEVPDDAKSSGDEKIDRIALALRIPKDGDVNAKGCELTTAEKTLLCARIEKMCSAVHIYRAIALLDPERVRRKGEP